MKRFVDGVEEVYIKRFVVDKMDDDGDGSDVPIRQQLENKINKRISEGCSLHSFQFTQKITNDGQPLSRVLAVFELPTDGKLCERCENLL